LTHRRERSVTRSGLYCGLVLALPLVAVGLSLWLHHWVPGGDDSVIAWRSYDVLTPRSPLVGQLNLAGPVATGPAVFDPGPLEYWALALPVRVLPADIGPVVGALAVGVAALGAAAVAVTRRFGCLPAFVVTVVGLVGMYFGAVALRDPVWNPFAALLPFTALLLIGWVVASGSLGWWPVLVGLASYCTQLHLMYAPASILIVVSAPGIGLLVRTPHTMSRRDLRCLAIGLGVGLVAWSAPLYQQVTGRPGNLASIWGSTIGGTLPTVGWWYALDRMAHGIGPRPVWLGVGHPQPIGLAVLTSTGRQGWTLAAVALVILIGVLGHRQRKPDVVALALITLIALAGGLWAIAGVTHARVFALEYITWIIWPIGMLTWLAVGWGALRLFGGSVRASVHRLWTEHRGLRRAAVAGLACISLVVALDLALTIERSSATTEFSPTINGRAAVAIAGLVERDRIPRGRLHVLISGVPQLVLLPALSYQLAEAGWEPTLSPATLPTTPNVLARPTDPVLEVDSDAADEPTHARQLGVVTVRNPGGGALHWTVDYVAPSATPGASR
jgi:hypothetical protein